MTPFIRTFLLLAVFLAALVFESQAFAARVCPPGTHWSRRYRVCVTNRPYRPYPPHRRVCPPGYHFSHYYRVCVPNR